MNTILTKSGIDLLHRYSLYIFYIVFPTGGRLFTEGSCNQILKEKELYPCCLDTNLEAYDGVQSNGKTKRNWNVKSKDLECLNLGKLCKDKE